MPTSETAQVVQDMNGNVGIAVHPQSGTARCVPFLTANMNVDENGNIGVFCTGGGISEAPLDGKYYARSNGQWIETDIVMTESELALTTPPEGTIVNIIED